MIVILASLKTAFRNQLYNLFNLFIDFRILRPALRESQSITGPVIPFLIFNYAFAMAIILHFLNQQLNYRFFDYNDNWWLDILMFSGILLSGILLKMLIIFILEFIIGEEAGQRQYRREIMKNYAVLGILLLPIGIALSLNKSDNQYFMFKTALILWVLFYLYRLLRGMISGIHAGAYPLYIFYYLCALELVPLIFFIKVLMR